MRRCAPFEPTDPNTCMWGGVPDVINRGKFFWKSTQGFRCWQTPKYYGISHWLCWSSLQYTFVGNHLPSIIECINKIFFSIIVNPCQSSSNIRVYLYCSHRRNIINIHIQKHREIEKKKYSNIRHSCKQIKAKNNNKTVWGSRGIRYTVKGTTWQKSRGGAVLWNRLS